MERDYPATAHGRGARTSQSRPFVAPPVPLIVVRGLRVRCAAAATLRKPWEKLRHVPPRRLSWSVT